MESNVGTQQFEVQPLHPAVTSLAKRTIDLIGALTGLLIGSPLILAAAIAIRITMGRPILFIQERPGHLGKGLRIVKLRTMLTAAEGENWFRTDRTRVTRVGSFLRRTSIDELPSLWNVLRGEMSLVGPRPLLTEYLSKYTEAENQRHAVKPGVTGLAQVSGRQELTFSRRLELDRKYVRDWSLALDLKILLRTTLLVLSRRGNEPGQDLDSVDDLGLSPDRKRKE